MSVDHCKVIQIPKVEDLRGNLSFIEGTNHVPFDLARIYYIYDVPQDANRGAHAHIKLEQFIIAVTGSFEVTLTDGFENKKFMLDQPCEGLYVTPMVWRSIKNFSKGSICLVLASRPYEENDYIRSYDDFLAALDYSNES